MRAKSWVEGDVFSASGKALRDEIESDTDDLETPIVDAIGNDFDELVHILQPWATAIYDAGIAGGGYPGNAGAILGLASGGALSRGDV
jgi:hypothetical protein